MKIRYYGHACFAIESEEGLRIVIDPYTPGGFDGAMRYGPIRDAADIVLTTHQHADHNYVQGVPGNPRVIKGAGTETVDGIAFKGVEMPHDEAGGSKRGKVDVFTFTVDGVTLCHVGDLGKAPTEKEAEPFGNPDVLFLPVGGYFTIDAEEATETMRELDPRITIPMHFKTAKVDFPIAPVDEFLAGKKNVREVHGSEVTITKATLPPKAEILVLEPAL